MPTGIGRGGVAPREGETRITSYNVCYTKLLRLFARTLHEKGGQRLRIRDLEGKQDLSGKVNPLGVMLA